MIDLGLHFFGIRFLRREIVSEEDLLGLGVVDRSEFLRKSVSRDHLAGDVGRALDIVARSRADVVQSERLRHTSAEQVDDRVIHVSARLEGPILFRQAHSEAARGSSRDDGYLVDRVAADRAHHYSVSGLVVRGEPALLLADHSALFRRSCEYFRRRFLYLDHPDLAPVPARGDQSRLVQQVFEIGRRKARCAPRDDLRRNVVGERFIFAVDSDDLFASLDVRDAYDDLAVKTARPEQSGIEHVRTVRRRDDYDARVFLESVHFNEQLVQSLLALVVASAESGASLAAYRVDLIDEEDARRVFLCLVEQVADARRAYAYEHFNKVGPADAEERDSGFARHGSGNVRLARSRRAYEQDARRDPGSQRRVFARVFKEIHDLAEFLFFLLKSCHVGKGDFVVVLIQSRLAFAELEGFAVAALIHHHVHQ